MTDPDGLPDGWWSVAESIAGAVARNRSAVDSGIPRLPYADRREAAIDGIVAEVHENGWLAGGEQAKRLFRAAQNAIDRASDEAAKHIRWWSYWYDAPGQADALGEAVTDKIGVHQLCYTFTDEEWSAVWALARVQAWDGAGPEAAALLQVPYPVFHRRLFKARQRARPLWVAPGDTAPSRQWVSAPGTRSDRRYSRRHSWADSRRKSGIREDRRAELAEAVMSGTAKLADVYALSELTNENITVGTIRQWIRDGDLTPRGIFEKRRTYSVDEFVRLAIERGRLGSDPRKQQAS